jgi:hypothetical protein
LDIESDGKRTCVEEIDVVSEFEGRGREGITDE